MHVWREGEGEFVRLTTPPTPSVLLTLAVCGLRPCDTSLGLSYSWAPTAWDLGSALPTPAAGKTPTDGGREGNG
jgi:hypothetical protein